MTDLVTSLVDREVAKDGLGLELKAFATDEVRIQAAGPPRRVHEELAGSVLDGVPPRDRARGAELDRLLATLGNGALKAAAPNRKTSEPDRP